MHQCAIYNTTSHGWRPAVWPGGCLMNMRRDFEMFLGGPNEAIAQRMHVTISPQRIIRLNRNMYAAMGKPSAVRLSYSRTRDIIAIEASSIRQPEAFPVMPEGSGWRISAAPFGRHFKIEIDSTLKFIAPDLVGSTLYLSLTKTITVSRRKRKKK